MSMQKTLKEIRERIAKSNNRSLGTLFGCIMGGIVGIIYVLDGTATLAIVGRPDTIAKSVLAVLLAAGTGGNLSSYIGATVDIITGEKTIIDLFKSYLNKNIPAKDENVASAVPLAVPEHRHFSFISSIKNREDESLDHLPENERGLFFLKKQREENYKAFSEKIRELEEQKNQKSELENKGIKENSKAFSSL